MALLRINSPQSNAPNGSTAFALLSRSRLIRNQNAQVQIIICRQSTKI